MQCVTETLNEQNKGKSKTKPNKKFNKLHRG